MNKITPLVIIYAIFAFSILLLLSEPIPAMHACQNFEEFMAEVYEVNESSGVDVVIAEDLSGPAASQFAATTTYEGGENIVRVIFIVALSEGEMSKTGYIVLFAESGCAVALAKGPTDRVLDFMRLMKQKSES